MTYTDQQKAHLVLMLVEEAYDYAQLKTRFRSETRNGRAKIPEKRVIVKWIDDFRATGVSIESAERTSQNVFAPKKPLKTSVKPLLQILIYQLDAIHLFQLATLTAKKTITEQFVCHKEACSEF